MFVDKQFNIVVNDVNEAPILVGLTKSSVDENLSPGALVGLFTSMDPDNEGGWRQNVTYVLNGMIAPFVINGTGLVTTMTFDYEKNSSYSINVTATDTGNPPASTSVKITINVTDVNDRPTQITFNSSGLKENSPGDTFVGELGTVDEDMGQTHVYSIIPDGHIESRCSALSAFCLLTLFCRNILYRRKEADVVKRKQSGLRNRKHVHSGCKDD